MSHRFGEGRSEGAGRRIPSTPDGGQSEAGRGRIATKSEHFFSPWVEPDGDTAATGRREEIIAAYRHLAEVRGSRFPVLCRG